MAKWRPGHILTGRIATVTAQGGKYYVPAPIAEVWHNIAELGVNFTILQESIREEPIGVGVVLLVAQDSPDIVLLGIETESERHEETHQVLAKTVAPFGR